MEIDELGLNSHDRRILNVLIENSKGRTRRSANLSSPLPEDEATIEDVYEPFLLQLGL